MPGAIAGFGATDLIGEYAADLFVADDTLAARALFHRAARGRAMPPLLARLRHVDGTESVVRVSARRSSRTTEVRIRACSTSESDAFYAGAEDRARFDALTGLPNRILFLERVSAALETGAQTLALIDVDRVRRLAAAIGGRTADHVIVEIADRFVALAGASGVVGVAGGQFAVLVPCDPHPNTVTALVARFRAAIGAPFETLGDDIVLGTCVGIASSTSGAEILLMQAEIALAQAMSLGSEREAVFDPAFRLRTVRRIDLQSDLSRAVVRDELRLDFQPIIELETGALAGYEALVRWRHPVRGVLAPRDFLRVAQECAAGADIDDWVLHEACSQGARSVESGSPATVSVNTAPERFAAAGFAGRVERALAATGFDAARLIIEITETSILTDGRAARDTIAALHSLGIRVALDDYGTGYSSLADVAELPIDELKIDRAFVAGLGTNRASTAVVRAIVELGHTLGITVAAEGVETPAQAAALRRLRCPLGQGFLFGRPAPSATLVGGRR